MKLTTILACVTAVVALPSPQLPPPSLCLTDKRAQYIVEREKVYLQKANITDARLAGEELFAADFVQYGDSINSLRGDPVSSIRTSREYSANKFSSEPSLSQTVQRTSTTHFQLHLSQLSTPSPYYTTAHISSGNGNSSVSVVPLLQTESTASC